jgi:DNA-binding CsgD family transcriptional regulator
MNETDTRNAPSMQVLIENLPGNVYRRVRSPEGRYHFEFLSSGLFRHFDIDHRRLLGEHRIRFDWIHPEDRDRFVADLELSAATLRLLDHRVRVVGEDGRIHWARGIARPSRRADGSVVWDGIVIDVTREVEAEAALRIAKTEAERAHGTVASAIGDATRRLDAPLRHLEQLLAGLSPGIGLDEATLASLRACQRRLVEATGDLAPGDRGAAPSRPDHPPSRALTGRQREVLRLLEAGLSNKAIAQRLTITPGTAKLHVAAVLRLVGVRSRRHLLTPRSPTGV